MICSPKTVKALPSEETRESLNEFSSSLDPSNLSPELVVELPVWSTEWADLHSVASLRERALSTLHHLCDDLKEQGYNPSYKLIPSPTIYSSIKINCSMSPSPSVEQVDEWSRSPVHKTILLPSTGRSPTLILI